MNQKINKQYLINFFKKIVEDKFILGIVMLAILSIIVSVSLLIGGENNFSKRTGIPNVSNHGSGEDGKTGEEESSEKGFNFFGLLSEKDQGKDQSSENSAPRSLKGVTVPNGNPNIKTPPAIKKVNADGSSVAQTLNQTGSTNTIEGTIDPDPDGGLQEGVDSDSGGDSIAISFQNSDGSITEYVPPGTPEDEIRWGRYTNTTSGYALNFPVNWQFTYSVAETGDELLILFPPNVDPDDPESENIVFGFNSSNFNPVNTILRDAYTTTIIVDGQTGNLYTKGPLGPSYIASILNTNTGLFGLMASKSDELFAYVYYFMIHSLTFNVE